jgi:hypothetical protein
MNCMYETVAEAYIRVRGSFFSFTPAIEDELGEAEEILEASRANLAAKERDAAIQCATSGRAAVLKRKAGDLGGAKYHLQVFEFLLFCFHGHPVIYF